MLAILAILTVAALCVVSYGFGWYWRGSYDAPYLKKMCETLNEASDVFDAYAALDTPEATRNRKLAAALHEATLRPFP